MVSLFFGNFIDGVSPSQTSEFCFSSAFRYHQFRRNAEESSRKSATKGAELETREERKWTWAPTCNETKIRLRQMEIVCSSLVSLARRKPIESRFETAIEKCQFGIPFLTSANNNPRNDKSKKAAISNKIEFDLFVSPPVPFLTHFIIDIIIRRC